MHSEQMLAVEARIDRDEASETAQHESRTHGKKKCEEDFCNNETAAQGLMAPDTTATKSPLLARVLKVHAGNRRAGTRPKRIAVSREAKKVKSGDAAVDGDRFAAGRSAHFAG